MDQIGEEKVLGHYGAQLNSSSLRLLHWKYILQFREIHLATLTNTNKGGSDSGGKSAWPLWSKPSLNSSSPSLRLLRCTKLGGKDTFMFQINLSQNKHNAILFNKLLSNNKKGLKVVLGTLEQMHISLKSWK